MSPEASIVRVLAWLSKRFALALRGAVSRRLNEPQNLRKRALASHVGKVRKKFFRPPTSRGKTVGLRRAFLATIFRAMRKALCGNASRTPSQALRNFPAVTLASIFEHAEPDATTVPSDKSRRSININCRLVVGIDGQDHAPSSCLATEPLRMTHQFDS